MPAPDVLDSTTVVSGASIITVTTAPAQIYSIIPNPMSGTVSASGSLIGVYNTVSGAASGITVYQWYGANQSGPNNVPPILSLGVSPITCLSGIVVQGAAGYLVSVIWGLA